MAANNNIEGEFATLEERVEDLLKLCKRLSTENQSLRAGQDQLVSARADMLSRQEQARVRVDAMINRLKALEQEA